MVAIQSAARIFLLLLAGSACSLFAAPGILARALPQDPSASTATAKNKPTAVLPRGKKLILTDGTYQIIREYQRNGERVRYYSLERGDWEELPASMVDWAATAKADVEESRAEAAQVEKVHKQEEAHRMDNVADVDASLQVTQGVFLPDGEGMFVAEAKSVRVLDQVASELKTDKMRLIGQIMSPVPIVPGKQTLLLPGTRAALRLKTSTPEFYLRETPYNPQTATTIQRNRYAGDSGPEVVLIKTKVTKKGRQLESISTLFGEKTAESANALSIQRWEMAPGVYRFTLSQALPPGEYILTEVIENGLDAFVWEFGVDEAVGTVAATPLKK